MAGENEPTRQHAVAALWMWVWMACVVAFVTVAIIQRLAENLSVMPVAALNIGILVLVGWCAVGVRKGELLKEGATVLILYGILGLIELAFSLAFTSSSRASGVLIATRIVVFTAWLVALVMVLRAKPPKQTGGVVTTR